MTEFAFIIILTFFAGHGDAKAVRVQNCIDAHCVGKFERAARKSTALTRFQVFRRGSERRNVVSGIPVSEPIIDWSPL